MTCACSTAVLILVLLSMPDSVICHQEPIDAEALGAQFAKGASPLLSSHGPLLMLDGQALQLVTHAIPLRTQIQRVVLVDGRW